MLAMYPQHPFSAGTNKGESWTLEGRFLLGHVMLTVDHGLAGLGLILSKRHLHRVMKQYQAQFNHARPHQGIGQWTSCQPELRDGPALSGRVVVRPILGGLHYDYHWQPLSRESLPKAA